MISLTISIIFPRHSPHIVQGVAEGAKHVPLWAVTNMFQEDTWIFAAPDPAAVGIDLTTERKLALITESYGVQKSLIVLYPMKHMHTGFLTNHLICISKVLKDGLFVRL
jgi:hypothetical protein